MTTLTFQHPLFDSIEFREGEGAYVLATITLSGEELECGLHIDCDFVSDSSVLCDALKLLEGLASLHERAKKYIANARGDESRLIASFFNDHLNEMPAESLRALGLIDINRSRFLEKLKLRCTSIRKEEEAFHLVLDYCIGADYSDQLLCVYFDGAGAILNISHES